MDSAILLWFLMAKKYGQRLSWKLVHSSLGTKNIKMLHLSSNLPGCVAGVAFWVWTLHTSKCQYSVFFKIFDPFLLQVKAEIHAFCMKPRFLDSEKVQKHYN